VVSCSDNTFFDLQKSIIVLETVLCSCANSQLSAFVMFVRPLLEYNCIIWSPSQRRDIDLLEQVQWRFTKRLQGFCHYPYEKRLQLHNIPKLETRRLEIDLIWCYKILFGHVFLHSASGLVTVGEVTIQTVGLSAS